MSRSISELLRQMPPENHEKVGPNEFFLVGEPILTPPPNTPKKMSFLIPKGSEHWVNIATDIATGKRLTPEEEKSILSEEYWEIVQRLKLNGVPFHFLVAHPDLVEQAMVNAMVQILALKGVQFFPQIPHSLTCFPRDLFCQIDDKLAVNPEANLQIVSKNPQVLNLSLLGEGGILLKSGSKILLPDPNGYKHERKTRREYERDIQKLANNYRVGLLPWPVASEISFDGKKTREFTNCHLDRAMAFVRGNAGQDHLLVDSQYFEECWLGREYEPEIVKTCQDLEIKLIVIDKQPDDVPYGFNLVQFNDGSVFLSRGTGELEEELRTIIGDGKVFTTSRPIVFFPVLRYGGIRCLTATVPKWFFKPKV